MRMSPDLVEGGLGPGSRNTSPSQEKSYLLSKLTIRAISLSILSGLRCTIALTYGFVPSVMGQTARAGWESRSPREVPMTAKVLRMVFSIGGDLRTSSSEYDALRDDDC